MTGGTITVVANLTTNQHMMCTVYKVPLCSPPLLCSRNTAPGVLPLPFRADEGSSPQPPPLSASRSACQHKPPGPGPSINSRGHDLGHMGCVYAFPRLSSPISWHRHEAVGTGSQKTACRAPVQQCPPPPWVPCYQIYGKLQALLLVSEMDRSLGELLERASALRVPCARATGIVMPRRGA